MKTQKWTIDPMHSEIHFKVKHLMINTVTGAFKTFSGTVENTKPDFSDAKIQFTADVSSIDTNMAMRDNHLKGEDFFHAEKYPQVKFESTSIVKTGDEHFKLHGNLSIREVTKAIDLTVEFGGTVKDSYGNTKAGFEISGKLKRKEFGLIWDAVSEAGGVVVSDEIRLHLNVQLQLVQEVAAEQPAETNVA